MIQDDNSCVVVITNLRQRPDYLKSLQGLRFRARPVRDDTVVIDIDSGSREPAIEGSCEVDAGEALIALARLCPVAAECLRARLRELDIHQGIAAPWTLIFRPEEFTAD